jgi:hypothetical protein
MYTHLNALFKVDILYPQACYCMCSTSFLVPTAALFNAYNNCLRVSSLPLWFTLGCMQTQRKKSNGATGKAMAQVHLFLTTCRHLCAEIWRCPLLLYPHSPSCFKRNILLNISVVHFAGNSCNKVFWDVRRWNAVQWGSCPIPHTTHLQENGAQNSVLPARAGFHGTKSGNSVYC